MVFLKHIIKKENEQKILYLYLDPLAFSFEFGKEYNKVKQNNQKISKDIDNYIKERKIKWDGKQVKIFLGTIVISNINIDS